MPGLHPKANTSTSESNAVSAAVQGQFSSDEQQIRALIDQWAKAVREQNMSAVRANHDAHMLMFDVPPPLLARGLDAYMKTWDLFYACAERPIVFDFHDIEVTAGQDVAFATAIGQCTSTDKGQREDLEFRLTMGLHKVDGAWRIVHEHHSIPAE
jgi:uncharacterized protein (TIGR02246 family)